MTPADFSKHPKTFMPSISDLTNVFEYHEPKIPRTSTETPNSSSNVETIRLNGSEDLIRKSLDFGVPGISKTLPEKQSKTIRFEDYYLSDTLDSNEKSRVNLGWKTADQSVHVPVELFRWHDIPPNLVRLASIYDILREFSHSNISRFLEQVETETPFDNAARRLFLQLISGVGYLHKKGLMHFQLDLNNLLLDHNRNIIIVGFSSANTFDLADRLTEEEANLHDRTYVQKNGLYMIQANGCLRGDLISPWSPASPFYAAPELKISDLLIAGREYDIWSCGVILYAMLAGYLPWDDDSANPHGKNSIVSIPLTFPRT